MAVGHRVTTPRRAMNVKRSAGLVVRLLVVLAVVPALVLRQTGAAEAATHGPVVYGDIRVCEGDNQCTGINGPGPLPSIDSAILTCHIGAAYVSAVTGTSVRYSADCQRNAVLALDDSTTPGGFEDTAVTFRGSKPDGFACGMIGTFDGIDVTDDTTGETAAGCEVEEVCVDWYLHSWGSVIDGHACAPFPMGALPVPDGSNCPLGYPTGDVRTEWSVSGGDNYYRIWTEIKSVAAFNTRWFVKAYVRDTVTGAYSMQWHDSGNDFETSGARTIAAGGVGEHYIRWRVLTGSLHPMDVLGIEVTASEPNSTEDPSLVNQFPTNNVVTQSMKYPATTTYSAGGTNWWGATDQPNCRFYIGDPTYASPDATVGVPFAPLNINDANPPAPTDPPATSPEGAGGPDAGCDFDITSPTTWLSGGMCAAVGLLGEIVRALGRIASAIGGLAADIAGAIVGALGSLLNDLLVPSEPPDFADISMPTVSTWVPEVPDLSAGGCGAISMPSLDFGMAGSTSAVAFVNTCNAPWPDVRLFTYNGLLALSVGGIIRAMYRAVMNALGMGVEAASGGDDK